MFDWDEKKRKANLVKHRLDFSVAHEVFDDPFVVEEEDRSMDYFEVRHKLTGLANNILVTIIYTERRNVLRIISFRRATAIERRRYEEG